MVSYEVSISFIINIVLVRVGSCNFSEIVIAQKHIWFGFLLFRKVETKFFFVIFCSPFYFIDTPGLF